MVTPVGTVRLVKERVRAFLKWNVVEPVADLQNELLFQEIFAQQCRGAKIEEVFYPVGSAACHAFMYALFRTLNENTVDTVMELGSGQTTLLIDRIKTPGTTHICIEDDRDWHERLGPTLRTCDYRLSPLDDKVERGIAYRGYREIPTTDFDLLVVDGPRGVDRYSRFDCVPIALGNTKHDYLIMLDDARRPGEQQTITHLLDALKARGDNVKVAYGTGATSVALLASGRFAHCIHYF